MFKKLLVILMIGLFLLSACSQKDEEPIELTDEPTEAVNENDPVTAKPTEEVVEVQPGETETMPCTTVFDYPTSEEADYYQAIVDQLEPVTEEDRIYGNPDAPITIMEYADFQCPACPSFSLAVKGLVDEYPDSIRFVFRHLPLYSIHDKAYISSMAAEAAGAQDPAKFWEMHDILYIYQQQWNALSEDEFVDWVKTQAADIGLDVEQFEADLYDEDVRAAMEVETNERLSMGVNYTPFKVVNGRIYQDNKPDIFGLLGIYEFGGFEECPPWVIEADASYIARLDTSAGIIDIELFPDVAPLAVNSFVFLAQQGWFDEIYFHRVEEGFVAQAGDPSGQGYVGPGYTFANETNNDLSYDSAGIVGMANAGVDTNGSQFFITLSPATQLDGGYTIFGKVTEETLPVLDEIAIRNPSTATSFEGATIINSIEIIEP